MHLVGFIIRIIYTYLCVYKVLIRLKFMVIMTALFTQMKSGITADHKHMYRVMFRCKKKKDTNMATVRNFLVVSGKFDVCTVCV